MNHSRSQLCKKQIALSDGSVSIQTIMQLVSQILIRWLVIYPLDSTIQLLTNWGQDLSTCIISRLRKPLSIWQSDWRVKHWKQISGNSLNPLEAQNKDISAASPTSLTKFRLRLWCRLATLKQWQIWGRGRPPPPTLIFRPNWSLEGGKNFFGRLGPPLSKGWIQHCKYWFNQLR